MKKQGALNGFKIESGIPLPPRITNHGSGLTEVLRTLEVGQSFLVPAANGQELLLTRSRVSNIMAQAKGRLGRRFTSRRADGGIRVWRVE